MRCLKAVKYVAYCQTPQTVLTVNSHHKESAACPKMPSEPHRTAFHQVLQPGICGQDSIVTKKNHKAVAGLYSVHG